jgi:holliday junction DNA helicase RuvA
LIEYIKGILISKSLTDIIVETGGIGYSVRITLPAYDSLPDMNEEVKIVTHLHIKENPFSLILYGFSDEKERECFRLIISVSGVGPKTAMSILSAIGYRELTKFISSGNAEPLTSISGVGRKTAERLRVELKDKLLKPELSLISKSISLDGESGKVSEIAGALLSLGYKRIEAEKMIKKVSVSASWKELSVGDIIKEILRGR